MKYIINISGGKDSTACLLWALNEFNKKDIIPVFADTGFEHSEVYIYLKYLEKELKINIVIVKSKKYKHLLDCIGKKGMFPGSIRRFCTYELKLRPIWDYIKTINDKDIIQITGIRKNESIGRSKRYKNINTEKYPICFLNPKAPKKIKYTFVQFPIIDWSEKDCFQFLKKYNIGMNKLYKIGHNRVGCYPCVISGLKDYKKCWKNPKDKKHINQLMKLEEKLNKKKNCINTIKIKPDCDRFRLKKILDFEYNKINLFQKDEDMICKYCNI